MDKRVKKRINLHEDQPDLRGLHIGALPVEQIIIQIAVAFTEVELVDEFLIVHQVQRVKHVKVFL